MVLYNSNVVLGSVDYLVIRLAGLVGLGREGGDVDLVWMVMTDRLTLRIQVKDCLDRSVSTLHSFFRTLSSPGPPLFMSSSFSYHVSLHTSGRSKLYWFVSVPLCPSATSKYNQGISVDTVFSFYLDYSN